MREFKTIEADPQKQTSLDSEIIPDPMDGEQPDPDDESVTAQKGKTRAVTSKTNVAFSAALPKIKKRVPKGTSDYQAAWIIDDDVEEGNENEETGDDDDDESDEDDDMLTGPEDDDEEDDEDEYKTARSVIMEGSQAAETEGMLEDNEMDMEEVEKYRQEREDAQWPDEVDTPHDVPARERFQRYRGMKSFRFAYLLTDTLSDPLFLGLLLGIRRRICRWTMHGFSNSPTSSEPRSWCLTASKKNTATNTCLKLRCLAFT